MKGYSVVPVDKMEGNVVDRISNQWMLVTAGDGSAFYVNNAASLEIGGTVAYEYMNDNVLTLASSFYFMDQKGERFEVKKIKEACGNEFKVLCPGIRPSFSVVNDQKRISTPRDAIQNGADYIVLGRAVTKELNKVETMEKIYKEILNNGK